jgi:hypothetical protein
VEQHALSGKYFLSFSSEQMIMGKTHHLVTRNRSVIKRTTKLTCASLLSAIHRYENTWELRNTNTGSLVLQGGPFQNRQPYTTEECIPAGCHVLTVNDDFGDGLTAGGNGARYSVTVDGVQIAYVDNSQVWATKTHEFGCDDGGGGGGGGSCKVIELELKTDDWPEETSFSLVTDQNEYLWEEGNFDSPRATFNFDSCIDPGVCATFTFLDSFEDGLSSPGRITLTFDGGVAYSGRNFGARKVIRLCN